MVTVFPGSVSRKGKEGKREVGRSVDPSRRRKLYLREEMGQREVEVRNVWVGGNSGARSQKRSAMGKSGAQVEEPLVNQRGDTFSLRKGINPLLKDLHSLSRENELMHIKKKKTMLQMESGKCVVRMNRC